MGFLSHLWQQVLTNRDNFLPHAVCLDYGPTLWIHAISDGLIALSYYSIPFALVYLVWKRRDLEFGWMFVMFSLFILACGTTHLMGIWTLFFPDYILSGAIKAVTAAASLATAVALWPLLPKALALSSPRQLATDNAALAEEVRERHAAEARASAANAALEQRVSERTAELQRANDLLRKEICQRELIETQLRQAKEAAEHANLGKSKFIAAASHDLRQPIQAMFYFSQALSYRLTDDRGRETLADLDRSLSALKSLLDSLLDVSKLDAGAVIPHPATFVIDELLSRAAAEFGPSAAEKGLQLKVVPCRAAVRSDPALLSRILQNLVANAVRYTSSGRILVGARRRGGCLSIEVWDTGIGIPEERLADIFEEFTQLDTPQRDGGQGLGLGLAIVKGLCRLLGHEVTVRSKAGRGSVFAVRVPLITVREKSRAA